MIHPHSREVYYSDGDKFSRRALAVLLWIQTHGPATDREVMLGLGYREPNAVRPRITELVEAGQLEEVGEKRCQFTGKTVRIVGPAPRQKQLFANNFANKEEA